MKKTKYYLVSFAHEKGFGNMFFEAAPFLDIKAAEKRIAETGVGKAVIIAMNEIEKEQYILKNTQEKGKKIK